MTCPVSIKVSETQQEIDEDRRESRATIFFSDPPPRGTGKVIIKRHAAWANDPNEQPPLLYVTVGAVLAWMYYCTPPEDVDPD